MLLQPVGGERTTHRPLVITALVLAMLLAAIEATIIATAMPNIAASLGGFSLYGWVFSSYLLMQAVTTPIFGKLADVFGRKPVFIGGVSIFLAGSVACALAPSMPLLVLFRLIQGTGAGAVTPIAVTLAGDLYSLQERGKVQAYLSSVWGISSIVGPLAGGLIVTHIGWPWIFWLNLPVGLVAIGLIWFFLHENLEPRERSLDLLGAVLLLTALGSFMLALSTSQAWLWGVGLLSFVWFVYQQRRAKDPVVHLELWRDPLVLRGNLSVLMLGIGMMGLMGFLPTYVQGVLDASPIVAGFALSAMCIGWPVAAFSAGKLLLRMGVQPLVRFGGFIASVGALLIALDAHRGPIWAGFGSLVVGVGFGVLNTSFIVSIQTTVPWEKRGMATAGNMLMRNLGNALGAAVFGTVLNYGLAGRVSHDQLRELIGETLDPAIVQSLQGGLGDALQMVFWGVFAAVVGAALFAWGVPNLHLNGPSAPPAEPVGVEKPE